MGKVVNCDDVPNSIPPGEWILVRSESGNIYALVFGCPCKTHQHSRSLWLPISTGSKQGHKWLWDGNVDEPSITPSILRNDTCRWHGYMTKGKFVSC